MTSIMIKVNTIFMKNSAIIRQLGTARSLANFLAFLDFEGHRHLPVPSSFLDVNQVEETIAIELDSINSIIAYNSSSNNIKSLENTHTIF